MSKFLLCFTYIMAISAAARTIAGQKTITAVNLVIGLLIIPAALFLARDAVSLFLPVKAKPAGSEKKMTDTARHGFQDYSAILKKNPFGFPGGELKLLSASATGPAAPQPDVSLIGTIAGRPDVSFAIFADTAGQQEIFRVGQQVYGLGKLKKVEPGRVLIGEGAGRQEIFLKDITMVREVRSGSPQFGNPQAFGKKTGDSAYSVDPQRIQQAIEKPDQIMTDARFTPNIVNGKQQGFVLSEVKPGGVYSSLGLQNGDVLIRINEHSISTPESALQAFTALRGIDRAQLDIFRNGTRMSLTYSLR